MTLNEFIKQDNYCKENNNPEGKGCKGCSGENTPYCADALRNLCGKFLKALKEKKSPEFQKISKKLKLDYGMSAYAQLGITLGFIELPIKRG